MINIVIDGDISENEIDATIFELHLLKGQIRKENHDAHVESLAENIRLSKLNDDMATYENAFNKIDNKHKK